MVGIWAGLWKKLRWRKKKKDWCQEGQMLQNNVKYRGFCNDFARILDNSPRSIRKSCQEQVTNWNNSLHNCLQCRYANPEPCQVAWYDWVLMFWIQNIRFGHKTGQIVSIFWNFVTNYLTFWRFYGFFWNFPYFFPLFCLYISYLYKFGLILCRSLAMTGWQALGKLSRYKLYLNITQCK